MFKVFEHISEVEKDEGSYQQNQVLRLSDKEHPGYSKIGGLQINEGLRECLDFQDRKAFLKNTVKERMSKFKKHFPKDFSIQGPAINTDFNPRNIASFFCEVGSTAPISIVDFERDSEYGIKDTDLVFCLRGENGM